MISVKDELKLIRAENKSLHDDVKTLKQDMKTLLSSSKKEEDPSPPVVGVVGESMPFKLVDPSRDGIDAAARRAAVRKLTAAPSAPPEKKKNKPKKKRRKGKNRGIKLSNLLRVVTSGGASLTKIVSRASAGKILVSLITIALLASMTFGQEGIIAGGGDANPRPLLREQKGVTKAPANLNAELDFVEPHLDDGELAAPKNVAAPKYEVIKGFIQDVSKLEHGEVPVAKVFMHKDEAGEAIRGASPPSRPKQNRLQASTSDTLKKKKRNDSVKSKDNLSTTTVYQTTDLAKHTITENSSQGPQMQKMQASNIREKVKRIFKSAQVDDALHRSSASLPKDQVQGKQDGHKVTRREKRKKVATNAMTDVVAVPHKSLSAQPRDLKQDSAPLYYVDAANGICDYDPSNRPEPSDGVMFYDSVEECCDAEFSMSIFTKLSCVENSPSVDPSTIFSSTASTSLTSPANLVSSISPSVTVLDYAESSDEAAAPVTSSNPWGYVCDANPETCGCPNLLHSDYRGSINTTISGQTCLRWDETVNGASFINSHPNAGLEENFCRNPDEDPQGSWCLISEDDHAYCDIPACGDASCNANPEICGCPTLLQSDYRGSINTTISGLSCLGWNETTAGVSYISSRSGAGLEENFCRNPDEDGNGAWCITKEDGSADYCSVPTCDYVMCDADPETCGCPGLKGSDYRGFINTTKSGHACIGWDDDRIQKYLGELDPIASYPDAGLEGNFCRNPNDKPGGPWCVTIDAEAGPTAGGWDYCEVPVCGGPTAPPAASASLTVPASPTDFICKPADNEKCGCGTLQTDYQGPKNTALDGTECLRWDSELVAGTHLEDILNDLEGNFCRNPTDDTWGPWCLTYDEDNDLTKGYCSIPECSPCSCMPTSERSNDPCVVSNNLQCGCPSFLQSEECCSEDDADCKCDYLMEACRKSLENDAEEFCDIAEVECCKANKDPNCQCKMYEKICTESPSESTCGIAAGSCCMLLELPAEYYVLPGFTEEKGQDFNPIIQIDCACDFYISTENVLGYGREEVSFTCSSAREISSTFFSSSSEEDSLVDWYNVNGGDYWYNNDGWLDETIPHCEWYGLQCNDDGLLSQINLSNNNMTGFMPIQLFALYFQELSIFDISRNKLYATLSSSEFMPFKKLVRVDISENEFNGHADLLFSPVTTHVNFSHNKFTSVGFKKFNLAYETLRVVDISNNLIDQDVSKLYLNIPNNIEELDLSNNSFRGTIPNPFPVLESLTKFTITGNKLDGTLPDFSQSTPQLKELDVSNQDQADDGGLDGPIPSTLSKLVDLSFLDIAGNKFTDSIPTVIGNLAELRVLNLSSNRLEHNIPTELGKIKDLLEVLDLSDNNFEGWIPAEFGSFKESTSVLLNGNPGLLIPAPLNLCSLGGFDLVNDTMFCPSERSALREFYDSAKGREWTQDTNWLEPYVGHCDWYGVSCNDSNETIKLELPANGLSGTLDKGIAQLSLLEFLDLSDNDIKGSIPEEIEDLSNLIRLRLSYNSFIGNETNLDTLLNLTLVHLHGNRLSGVLNLPTELNVEFLPNQSSYLLTVAIHRRLMNPLNVHSVPCAGDCYPQEDTTIQQADFNDYVHFSWAFIGILLGGCCALALVVFAFDKYQNRSLPRRSFHRVASSAKDLKYALDTLGDGSVYHFFLGRSLAGWAIVLATAAIQMYMLFVFVEASEIEVTEDNTDLVYTWKCPRDEIECDDKNDLTRRGWVVFGILMFAHLMKDIINGVKLIVLSAKERHDTNTRWRFFVGGTLLTIVTVFTFYVSTIYNYAIATSNAEIIMNAVIILFICDIDELFYEILVVINPRWVESMSHDDLDLESDVENNDQSAGKKVLEDEVDKLKREVESLSESIKMVLAQNAEMKERLSTPQDTYA